MTNRISLLSPVELFLELAQDTAAVRSAASQDTHLDKHLETVKNEILIDNRVTSKESVDQREYVQFQTNGCGSHRWDRGWEESGEGSVYQYFLDAWVGLRLWWLLCVQWVGA